MTVGARSEKIEDSRYENRYYRVLVPEIPVWKLDVKSSYRKKVFGGFGMKTRYYRKMVPSFSVWILGSTENFRYEKLETQVLRKRWYILHPDSVFDDLGLVGITTTSPTTLCIETSLSTSIKITKRRMVWPIYKRHPGKTSKLENAIEDAYKFRFQWTWACCKARNKLKNLTQRNTKKQQENGMQSMQWIELPMTMWSSYPTESPSW